MRWSTRWTTSWRARAAAVGSGERHASPLEPSRARRHGTPASARATARMLVPQVLAWLRERRPESLLDALARWPHESSSALPPLLSSQGLAPRVAHLLEGCGPDDVAVGARPMADWLRRQLRQNRERMRRFSDDLAGILAGAATAGVPVMPLKGSVIAFTHDRDPGLRPMADLDLLVRPADEPGLRVVLESLGYRLVDASDPRHRTFGRPSDAVVAWDGTHPDNPRWVEVHTQVRRSVWRHRRGVDATSYLWSAGREATLLGQPAWLLHDAALLSDVAAHATHHLGHGFGTLLQWLDVAGGAVRVETLDDAFAPWTYPALALAARAFPNPRLAAHVTRLAPLAGAKLVELSERVPLDDRAGLNLRGAGTSGWWRDQWRRWRPNPWLVRMAHPNLPVVWAYPAYLAGVGAHGAARIARALRHGS